MGERGVYQCECERQVTVKDQILCYERCTVCMYV